MPPYARMHEAMSIRFSLPRNAPSDAFFNDMPTEVREFLKYGFAQLETFPQDALVRLATQATRWLDPVEPAPEIEVLAREFNVDEQCMSAVVAVVTLQASALFAGMNPMPLEIFVTRAMSGGILNEDHAAATRAFAEQQLKPQSAAFSDALARANSSTDIVPSFQDLDTTIDLRVAAVNEERVVTVPIVVATLRTDVRDQRLVFQMTPRDVGQLLQELKELAERIDRAKGVVTQPVRRK